MPGSLAVIVEAETIQAKSTDCLVAHMQFYARSACALAVTFQNPASSKYIS